MFALHPTIAALLPVDLQEGRAGAAA